jgi:hypothetical protein
MKSIMARHHANGSVAQVFLQPNGLYKAQELPQSLRGGSFSTDIEDLERAKEQADALTHPGCSGKGCGPWKDFR